MRIGGLASGMDTDNMVKQMMKAESIKLDRVKQEKQAMEWKQKLYNELNKDFANFILKSKETFGYRNGRSTGSEWAVKSTSSDEKIATIGSQRNTIEGNHSIDIKRLADGVKGGGTLKEGITNTTTFGEMGIGIGGDGEPEEMTININGADITFSKDNTIGDFVNKINNAKKTIKGEDGKDIEVSIGVKASYDGVNNKFFIQSTGVGKESGSIDITADEAGAKFINETLNLKLSSYDDKGELSTGEKVNLIAGTKSEFKGVDAKIEYNGLEMEQGSNDFYVNGMTIKLKDTGKVNINISKDQDVAVEKIKEFVEEYNKMLDKISDLLGEKVNRDFKPLTDEQREAMSEKEIELWEEKAKSGLLRNDSYLTSVLSNMRTDLYKNVEGLEGAFKNITEIGITTQEYKAGAVGGKLQIDEEKLRNALSKDFDGVMDLLFKEDSINAIKDDSKLSREELTKKRANSGIITRIFDNITVGIKEIVHQSGTGGEGDLLRQVRSNILVDFTTKGGKYSGRGSISDIDDELFKFDKKLDDLAKMLLRKENAYYAKFTAMEKAMQQMASQSGWLSQQTGGGF